MVLFAGAQWEPVHTKARETRVAGSAEGMSPAAPGRGGGWVATTTEAILRAAVPSVQKENAACPPQPGARLAQRGKYGTCTEHVICNMYRSGPKWCQGGVFNTIFAFIAPQVILNYCKMTYISPLYIIHNI